MIIEVFSSISLYGLIFLFLYNLILPLFRDDKSSFWSPMTFITLVYIYYILLPYYSGDTDHYEMNIQYLADYTIIGAFVSYLGVHVAFHLPVKYTNFEFYNNVFEEHDTIKLAICLYAVGVIGYSAFRGLTLDLFSAADTYVWEKSGDLEFYFTSLIAFGCIACSIFFVRSNSILFKLGSLLVILIIYIICGFRYRMVILAISIVTTMHLIPCPKRPNYKYLIPLAIVMYSFFGMMDSARNYSGGLRKDVVVEYDYMNASGAKENAGVFSFSGYVMTEYTNREKVYFQPLWCALTLPLPRYLFPWKPNADYVKEISTAEYHGAAFTYFAEAYMAFGWCGVLLYGMFLGWLSRKVWCNYVFNSNNINAVVFLALFNGFTYVMISRGYMAQSLVTFVYFVVLPFWVAKVIKRLIGKS